MMFVGISPTSRDEGAPPIVHPTMRTTLPNLRVLAGTLAAAMLAPPFAALRAQSPRPCPPVDGPVLLPCQVDRPPTPLSTNAIPAYPTILRSAKIGGTVRARFVIDTAGRQVAGSLTIVQSSNDLLTASIRRALAGWIFTPAVRDGHRVAVRYQEEFVFDQPRTSDAPPGTPLVMTRDTAQDGTARIVIGGLERVAGAASAFSEQDLLAAQASVAAKLASGVGDDLLGDRAATVCIGLLRGRKSAAPDARVLRDAPGPRRRAVTLAKCPRTYASMITRVDSLGRPVDPAPPGWVDPFILTVTRIEPWTRDVIVVTADLEQGTGGRQYRCGVRRAGATWRADCVAGPGILH